MKWAGIDSTGQEVTKNDMKLLYGIHYSIPGLSLLSTLS